MISFADKWRPILIDGVQRMATTSRMPDVFPDFDGVFFVDSESNPRQRVAQHRLSQGATAHLERGGSVISSGCKYALPTPSKRG